MDDKNPDENSKNPKDETYFSDLLAKEEEISNEAYELVKHGLSLMNSKYYDDAIEIFRQAIELYTQIDAEEEIKAIEVKIFEINILKGSEVVETKTEEQISVTSPIKADLTIERDIDEKTMRILELQKRKEEEDKFQREITDLVEKAENLNRNYEIAMKKAIKKGKLAENPPFLEIIEIYEKIRQMVFEKDWKDQIELYSNQIELYRKKLEQDEKLRKIEAKKAQKEKEFEELRKVEEIDKTHGIEVQKAISEEEKKLEEKEFQQKVSEMVDYAEKIAREYELALKKSIKEGILQLEPVYPVVLNIYENIRDMLAERGWSDQAKIYSKQLKFYAEKLEKDNKIRELEAKKLQKQKDYEDSLKIKKKEVSKEKSLEVTQKSLVIGKELDSEINDLIDRVDKIERAYELRLKKQIKKGRLVKKSPYSAIIKIFEEKLKEIE